TSAGAPPALTPLWSRRGRGPGVTAAVPARSLDRNLPRLYRAPLPQKRSPAPRSTSRRRSSALAPATPYGGTTSYRRSSRPWAAGGAAARSATNPQNALSPLTRRGKGEKEQGDRPRAGRPPRRRLLRSPRRHSRAPSPTASRPPLDGPAGLPLPH